MKTGTSAIRRALTPYTIYKTMNGVSIPGVEEDIKRPFDILRIYRIYQQ